MRPSNLILVALVLAPLAMAGCNADPSARRELALMRSEILDLEDQYYALKSQHEQALRDLASCRGVEPESLKSRYSPSGGSNEVLYLDEYGGEILIDDPVYVLPAEPAEAAPRGRSPSARPTSPQESQPAGDGQSTTPDPTKLGGGDIDEIFIHPAFTEPQNVDDRPGDDGVTMLIQPRSGRGVPIPLAGDLTIKLLDPAAAPGQDQVGAWQFTAAEANLFRTPSGAPAQGFALNLPWERNFPRHTNLVLAVEYRTPDGRPLKSSKTLQIDPPDSSYAPDVERVAAWAQGTPRIERQAGNPAGPDPLVPPSGDEGTTRRSPRWSPVR